LCLEKISVKNKKGTFRREGRGRGRKMASSKMALKRLAQEFRDLTNNGADCLVAGPIHPDSMFTWEAVIEGPEGTPYEGGCFSAKITFPQDYPLSPPVMTFTSAMWHPNVYTNGEVCCSILHSPNDPTYSSYELASEQWSPVQSVEKILLSVISMLAEPNDQSPANVDAAKQWRQDREGFNRRVDDCVRQSLGFA